MDMNKCTATRPNADNQLSPTPITPPCVLDGSTGTDKRLQLQSTSSNRGSASVSENFHSTCAESVGSSLIACIMSHTWHNKSDCTVEILLKGMLLRCLPEEDKHNPAPDLLGLCLNAVLPICNAKAKEKGLRDYLVEYSRNSSKEPENYELVLAFNCALRALREIDVPLRKSTKSEDERILFHTNNPLETTHNGHILTRQPYIVLVSLDTARNTSRQEGDTGSRDDPGCTEGDANNWSEYAFKTAANVPGGCFMCADTFSMVEVRRTERKLPLPQEEYALKPVKPIPPLPSIYEKAEDLATHSKSTQPSDSAISSPLKDALPDSPLQPSPSRCSRTSQSTSRNTSFVPGSRKRRREDKEESSSSNKKVKAQPGPLERDAMLQSALYAADRMSHGFWISHAINLVIIDDVAYVWWYDNEGAIQSYGINFVEDLPYFLVLLLCFDRFTTKDWGIITEFTEGEAGHCVLSLPSLDSSCPDSTFTTEISQTDKIRDHFGIVGRATRMLSATSQSTISGPQGKSRNLKDMELVIKISWPETSLMDEAKIIEKANRIADQNEHVKGHIPDLIWSCNFAQYSTGEIRATLGIKSKSKSKSSSKVKSHRVLRIMLFRRLYPITDLTGDRFWKAFWQCFRCHYHLWLGGVEHNDISATNLMYDKLNDDRGILNDFDLAHLRGEPRPSGTERMGTMPFKAFDLLTKGALDGKVKRQYRHDCESFAWVLLWICCRYEDGKEIHEAPLSDFVTDDFTMCYAKKFSFLNRKLAATTSYKPYWRVVIDLLYWSIKTQLRQMQGPTAPEEEPTIDEVIEIYRNILEKEGFEDLSML